jgi:prolipoprotein diacylglyceryltransferase
MNIDFQNPSIIYTLFLSLAHTISWAILFWYGHRHKYPKIQWLLIIVTGYTCFTIGSHVLAVNVESLKFLFSGGAWPISGGKSLIGGLLLAIPAMLLLKHLLKFNYTIFEPYAFTIPLGIAIQRIGCFAAGCCYGTTTNLPWGISYNYGHQIHFTQWEQGLLSNNQLQSIAIHPVQLYETLLCFSVLALIIYIYKKEWLQNQLIVFFLLSYTVIRFIIEIFRAESAHTLGLNSYFGLNSVQWIMIISGICFGFILTQGNKNRIIKNKVQFLESNISIVHILWYVLLFVLVLVTPNFYSSLELLLLGILLIPLSALVFWHLFSLITVPNLRIATVSMCVLAMFLMSQNSPVTNDEQGLEKYHEISIGGYLGSNKMTYYTESCDGTKTLQNQYNEQYYLMGAGYKFVKELNEDEKLSFGLGAAYGSLEEDIEAIDINWQQDMYAISPFIQYDLKKWGFGLGLSVGDISLFRPPEYTAPLTIFRRYSVLPQAHLRFGNMNKVWGEFNLGYRFPGFAPATEFEVLLGIRGPKGNLVRFGTSAYHALVIRPEFYINKKFGIEPYVGLGGPLFSGSFTERKGVEGGLNLHYRIYKKK